MMNVGNPFRRAAIFGATGGIGAALATRLAESGVEVWAGSRSGTAADPALRAFRFDLSDEASIAAAAGAMADAPPDLVVVASGVLTLADGSGPERSYKQIDGAAMDALPGMTGGGRTTRNAAAAPGRVSGTAAPACGRGDGQVHRAELWHHQRRAYRHDTTRDAARPR